MDQEKYELTKKMLPFLMKPMTLLVLTVICIAGEVMWMYLGILNGNRWECLGLFVAGILMGLIGGRWTSRLWDEYYIKSLLKQVKFRKTPAGIRSTTYTVLALGFPMAVSFVLTVRHPLLPILQSYIFGFICGMNVVIYQWARQLPD